ncbi:biotin--[acetyl-CoA-carboxylase] ligase [Afifella sp. H1R]|uniref:biotin--[acetyl-CoA-carboxylase] ligase n=1 Tax=unclassified Afifella TaxID=2624128 RepID=UPI001F3E8B38|nr:biotin--[acetyl-CoA-carboxylase] ligase [Afifella sp. H1R]MCF1502699.1 biotin--[acetyl-CoA-carboxylase] ligase [Afifella sp. H1R]
MGFTLGAKARAAGFRLLALPSVGSTNSEAMRLAREGDAGRLWVATTHQTAGHGRRGRAWSTEPGNLAASLLLMVPRGVNAANLGFVAGLALHDALGACAPALKLNVGLDGTTDGKNNRLTLKWPNDALIDGGKVSGILLEASNVGDGLMAVVIGIGVNVVRTPPDLPYAATSLVDLGVEGICAEDVFARLADAWVDQENLWAGGRGFAAVRDAWLKRASGLGAPVAVKLGEEIIRGTFDSIDDEGRLLVRTASGAMRAVTAGEVHFSAAATVRI